MSEIIINETYVIINETYIIIWLTWYIIYKEDIYCEITFMICIQGEIHLVFLKEPLNLSARNCTIYVYFISSFFVKEPRNLNSQAIF